MSQDNINSDLKHYINERKRATPFWKKVFKKNPRPKEDVQEDIKEELETTAAKEEAAIPKEEKEELHEMEHKIEEVNKVEEEIEEKIEKEHEGLLKKFFKKLKSKDKKIEHDEDEYVDEEDGHNHDEHASGEHNHDVDTDEDKIDTKKSVKNDYSRVHVYSSDVDADSETKEMLKQLHLWILQLPPDKLQEFKNSNDFKLYTKVLKKHGLIK